jgi:predicted methyltransferase
VDNNQNEYFTMNKINLNPLVYLTLIFGLSYAASASASDQAINDAVSNKARPVKDIRLDINRKPAAVLRFFGVKAGMTVLDVYSTGGYYTEILSHVVGDKGKVIAHNSKAYRKFVGKSINNRYLNGSLANVEKIYAHPREIELKPEQLDMALMVLIYHDLYVTNAKNLITADNRRNLIKQIFKALKPGAILGIVDHVAPRGTGVEAATQWHRLSSTIVTKELKSFGFEFVGEDTSLRNRTDPHDISIFNSQVRRKTDRYILKFRKPI